MGESPTEVIRIADVDGVPPALLDGTEPATPTTPTPPKLRFAGIWGSSTGARGLSASYSVWTGLILIASGFVVITIAWAKAATQVDVVKQMPYVVPWGMAGLALIIVGIAVVDMAVRRQDRLERRQQLSQMRQVITELRRSFEEDQ